MKKRGTNDKHGLKLELPCAFSPVVVSPSLRDFICLLQTVCHKFFDCSTYFHDGMIRGEIRISMVKIVELSHEIVG